MLLAKCRSATIFTAIFRIKHRDISHHDILLCFQKFYQFLKYFFVFTSYFLKRFFKNSIRKSRGSYSIKFCELEWKKTRFELRITKKFNVGCKMSRCDILHHDITQRVISQRDTSYHDICTATFHIVIFRIARFYNQHLKCFKYFFSNLVFFPLKLPKINCITAWWLSKWIFFYWKNTKLYS